MSLPNFPQNDKTPSREDVINQILTSIAMEELGLSHVINAEGEKLQYALGTIPGSSGPAIRPTIEDLLALNKSVRDTLDSTMLNQMFLKAKMQSALEAYEQCGKFLSCYFEVLGNTQTVESGTDIVFDTESVDSVGNGIEIDATGMVITINRTGLYHIEWNINIAGDTPILTDVVFGIVENGEGASGAASSTAGNFSSGTLINVESVPFTITLRNYGDQIAVGNPLQWTNSAVSIRIVRFADGPLK